MAYQRAFSTLGCSELNLEQALALAAVHKLDGIELRALGGTLDLPAWLERNYRSPQELAQSLGPSSSQIVAFDTSFKLIGSTKEDRVTFLRYVPWAATLGVSWLRVFDGGSNGSAEEIAEAVATLRWWSELRMRSHWQMNLMIETHDALVTSAAARRLLDARPDVSLLWDSHHTWRKGGEDPLFTWRSLRPHIVYIHVKDSISVPRGPRSFVYASPGEGDFPMKQLASVLRQEFHGVVSLEWERFWHPELALLHNALQAADAINWW